LNFMDSIATYHPFRRIFYSLLQPAIFGYR
jgi:hypothetical protein